MLLGFGHSRPSVDDRTSGGVAPVGSGGVGDCGDVGRWPDRAGPGAGGGGGDAERGADGRGAEERHQVGFHGVWYRRVVGGCGYGNAEFTDQLVTLPGVTADVSVALAWNSSVVGTSLPSAVTGGTGSGWVITGFDQRLIVSADNSITYYGPGGLTGVFVPSGSAYTSPAQFQGRWPPRPGVGGR